MTDELFERAAESRDKMLRAEKDFEAWRVARDPAADEDGLRLLEALREARAEYERWRERLCGR